MSDALKADSVSVKRTWWDLNATNAGVELSVCSETTHMAAVEVLNPIHIHPSPLRSRLSGERCVTSRKTAAKETTFIL